MTEHAHNQVFTFTAFPLKSLSLYIAGQNLQGKYFYHLAWDYLWRKEMQIIFPSGPEFVHPALGENWLHYGDSTQLVLAQVSAHRNYKMMNLSCFKAMKCVVICSTAMENQYVLQCFIIVCKRNHRTDSLVKALNGRTHWKDWCWNWSTNTLAIWCEELTHWKRPRCRERLKAGGEGDDRERDGWMTSLTQWTWVWASSGSWWWTEKPGMLQSMGSQRVGHDWVTEQ